MAVPVVSSYCTLQLLSANLVGILTRQKTQNLADEEQNIMVQ